MGPLAISRLTSPPATRCPPRALDLAALTPNAGRARRGPWRATTRQFLGTRLDPKLGVLFEDGAVG